MGRTPSQTDVAAELSQVRVRFSPAWFAGINLRVLALTKSESLFYNTLGLCVLLLGCASGFSFALAAGYFLGVSPAHVWWLGAAWTVIMTCGIERLVLQTSASRKGWLVLVIVSRIVLSALLSVQLGEPLMLRINQDAINRYLDNSASTAVQAATTKATTYYNPQIKAAEQQITAIRNKETGLSNRAEHYTFLSQCEDDTRSCSTTGKLGCGTYCRHYARIAEAASAELRGMKPADSAQIASLRGQIGSLRKREGSEAGSDISSIEKDRGLIAREEALSAIARAHPVVMVETWFLRALFLALDLLPVILKVIRMLSVESPYEEMLGAIRRKEWIKAAQLREDARVEEHRIQEQGASDRRIHSERIRVNEAETIDNFYTGGTEGARDRRYGGGGGTPIRAWSLSQYTDEMTSHESRPVPIPEPLRRGALIGTALIAGLALLITVFSQLNGESVNGGWIAIGALIPVAALVIYTRGFTTAPAWALRASLAVLVAGLLMPLLIIAINI